MNEPLARALTALVERSDLALSALQRRQLELYLGVLEHWNRTINLTALPLSDNPSEAVARLVGEPLEAARFLPSHPFRWLDLGSGGGSPAVPLKILVPHGVLTMVESRARKAAFLREVVRGCTIAEATVVCCRIEELLSALPASSVDLVTSRAVRLDADVAEGLARLSATDCQLILFGPTDWSALHPWFEPRPGIAHPGMAVLRRRVFHVEH